MYDKTGLPMELFFFGTPRPPQFAPPELLLRFIDQVIPKALIAALLVKIH